MATLADEFNAELIRHEENQFVNPVWNELLQTTHARYMTLLNNDCLLRQGYLNEIISIMQEYNLALATPSAVDVQDITACTGSLAPETEPPIINRRSSREGHVMTLRVDLVKARVLPIPHEYKIYFGDDWLWGRLRMAGYKCAHITNRTCYREYGRTTRRFHFTYKQERRLAYSSREMTEASVFAGRLSPRTLRSFDRRRRFWKFARANMQFLKSVFRRAG